MPELPRGIVTDTDVINPHPVVEHAVRIGEGFDKSGRIATGRPEEYQKAQNYNDEVRSTFEPAFSIMGISDEPGTMGRELRAKLMNDLTTTTAQSRDELMTAIGKSLREFQSGGEMGELKGKAATKEGIRALADAAASFRLKETLKNRREE